MPPRAVRVIAHNKLDDEDEDIVEDPSSSDGEEDEEVEDEEEEVAGVDNDEGDAQDDEEFAPKAADGNRRQNEPAPRLKLSLGGKYDVCKVCGKRGHKAGFVGATYMDCPNRPCYLCKLVGHTTATCPYRIAPGHGCTAAAAAGGTTRGSGGSRGLLAAIHRRECDGSRYPVTPQRPTAPSYQVEAAILKVHTRRCCTLEFHPSHDGIVVSGDKKGGLAVWNFDQVHERTVYDTVHSCLANSIRFLPWIDSMAAVTASSDGTAKLVDLETGGWRPLLDLNPGGWVQGGPWHMVYGCDASPSLGTVVVGDSNGCVHLLDPRTRGSVCSLQLHRKGNKVVSVHMHPLHPPLVLTAGNDHSARIFDIRELSSSPSAAATTSTAAPPRSPTAAAAAAAADAGGRLSASPAPPAAADGGGAAAAAPVRGRGRGGGGGGGRTAKGGGGGGKNGSVSASGSQAELAVMAHPRVVNAAYFSPHTGQRILTTCQDNRLRVWDYAPYGCNGPADREIVHSHDFNRYLTPFKAEWDAKDPTESVFVVGRYISEDFGGVALHPVDILSAADGSLLRQLTDGNLTTISPVNKAHPRRPLIVSGSSRSLYLWAPVPEDDEEEGQDERARGNGPQAGGAGRGPGGSRGGGGGGGPGSGGGAARTSRTFISFDADPGGGKKRKKGGGKGADDGGDDEDD